MQMTLHEGINLTVQTFLFIVVVVAGQWKKATCVESRGQFGQMFLVTLQHQQEEFDDKKKWNPLNTVPIDMRYREVSLYIDFLFSTTFD